MNAKQLRELSDEELDVQLVEAKRKCSTCVFSLPRTSSTTLPGSVTSKKISHGS